MRTTDEAHRTAVHAFWRRLETNDIYLKNYSGLYCVGCEDFYLESDLVEGRCPDHDTVPVEVEERNYFFRLSRYREQLEDILSSGRVRVVPETRRNEVLSFVRRGLRDNSIDPLDCVAEYGADSLRYYLLRAVSPFADGDFSIERLRTLHNSDLANGLGNLVSRIATLCGKLGYGAFSASEFPKAPSGYHDALQGFGFDVALKHLWSRVARLNQDIDRKKPWETLKSGETTGLHDELSGWLRELHGIAFWLQPFLPATSKRIGSVISACPIVRCAPVFPRV